jgi:hypothetical protein
MENMEQLVEVAGKLASAVEAFSATVEKLQAQQDAMSERVERIVAMIEEGSDPSASLRAGSEHEGHTRGTKRKTLPAAVGMLLAKQGVEIESGLDESALDAALASLSIEQRVAVKSQLARAGMIL